MEGVGTAQGCRHALVGPDRGMGTPAVEPGMGVRGMVEDRIQHQAHAPPRRGHPQVRQGMIAAQVGVDVFKILDVVFVYAGRSEDGVEQNRGDTQVVKIVERLAHTDQVAPVELTVRPLRVDRLPPRLGPNRALGARCIGTGARAAPGVAVAEALREYLVEDLVRHPIRRRLLGVEAKEAFAQRHAGARSGRVQPALPVRQQHLECIDRQWTGRSGDEGRLIDLEAPTLRDRRHGQQTLLVVPLQPQVNPDWRRGDGGQPQLDPTVPVAPCKEGCDLMMDHGGCGHGMSPWRSVARRWRGCAGGA